jgi:hypothetical protein
MGYPDPLRYLNRIERPLVGWSVTRMFETNAPRFARGVKRSGPHAMARISCAQTFTMYIWLFALPGVSFAVVGLGAIADGFYIAAGICGVWAAACVISALKPQREYKRSRDGA